MINLHFSPPPVTSVSQILIQAAACKVWFFAQINDLPKDRSRSSSSPSALEAFVCPSRRFKCSFQLDTAFSFHSAILIQINCAEILSYIRCVLDTDIVHEGFKGSQMQGRVWPEGSVCLHRGRSIFSTAEKQMNCICNARVMWWLKGLSLLLPESEWEERVNYL